MTLETKRLTLRATTEEDAEFVYKLLNCPKWLEYIGDRKVYSKEDAIIYIQTKMLPQLRRLGHSNFTVIRKSDGAKVGSCGLYDREGLEGVDIGFAFLPEFERQGYGYEAAKKVMAMGFDQFGIQKIKAITAKNNIGSQKLLEKLGLRYIRDMRIPGDDEVLMLYELNVS